MRAWLVIAVAAAACNDPKPAPDAVAGPWQTGMPVPRKTLEPGVAIAGTRIAVVGGFDTNLAAGLHISQAADSFDTLGGQWTHLPDAPVAWTHLDLAAAGGSLYLLGGLAGTDFTARNETFELEVGGDAWQPRAPIPTGSERGAAAIVVAAPHIYLIGGASSTAALATCLDYNLMTDEWTVDALPPLPAPRSHAAALRRTDGTIIIAGGLSSLDASEPHADVWGLALGASEWVALSPMPTARGGCAYGEIGGRLVCAGGEAGAAALHVVEEYDPNTNTWRALPDMPEARAGTQGATIGERLYVPGGAASLTFEPTDSFFEFLEH